MTNQIIHVAIDGTVASGKGTIAKRLSESIGIPTLDTGAVYRGIAVHVANGGTIEEIASGKKTLTAKIIDNKTHVFLDKADVTGKLRDNEISVLTGKIAPVPLARQICTKIFQDLAKDQSLVVEGRDICSVVLPNARYKFYLTASKKVRAKRRYDELLSRGQTVPFKQVLKETKARDKSDMTKGGLKRTKDAILIDSSKLDPEQVYIKIKGYIK